MIYLSSASISLSMQVCLPCQRRCGLETEEAPVACWVNKTLLLDVRDHRRAPSRAALHAPTLALTLTHTLSPRCVMATGARELRSSCTLSSARLHTGRRPHRYHYRTSRKKSRLRRSPESALCSLHPPHVSYMLNKS